MMDLVHLLVMSVSISLTVSLGHRAQLGADINGESANDVSGMKYLIIIRLDYSSTSLVTNNDVSG
jgi:hypothetical protein